MAATKTATATATTPHSERGGRRRAVTMEKGPNDARHVVWAQGEFLFYIHILFILNYMYRCFLMF